MLPNSRTFLLLLFVLLFVVANSKSTTGRNFNTDDAIVLRSGGNTDCISLYDEIPYGLWKQMCGIQTAGKREQIPQKKRSDFLSKRTDLEKEEEQSISKLLFPWRYRHAKEENRITTRR